MTFIERLSPAALERYRLCPKRFRLQDLERRHPKAEPSGTLTVANAVHHALERFFGLPDEHRQPENLDRALRAVWPQHRKPGTFGSIDEEIRAGQAALEMLGRFAARADLCAIPLAREQWLEVEVEGVVVYGKVDRIDSRRRPADGLELIDYKTGRRALDASDLRHESAVQAYVAAAELAYGEAVTAVRFEYLSLDEVVVWDLNPDDAFEMRGLLAATVEELLQADAFPAQPGEHCRFCPFQLRCRERTLVTLEELVPIVGPPFEVDD